MSVTIKKLEDSSVEITGEIAIEDFESAYAEALKEYQTKVQVPGFRPGNAPEKMLIEKLGQQVVLERAAEIAIQNEYPKILERESIEAIGRPQISITKIAKGNPLGFKITTAVMPEIKLPDYKKIASEVMLEKPEIKVEEKEVQDSLEYLRKSKVKSQKLKVEDEPKLDDEFAKSLGDFDTLEDLKNALRQNIKIDKQLKAKEQKRMETLNKIAKESQLQIPEIMIEREKEKMLSELKSSITNMGGNWDEYLKHIKKSEEEMKKDWQKDAEKRLKYGLLLHQIAEQENIKPSEEELKQYIEKIMQNYPETERQNINRDSLREYSYGIIKNEKVFQLLEAQ